MVKKDTILLLTLIFGNAVALEGQFIMVIGGLNGTYLDDVELVSIDPLLHPVPDCLSRLNPLPELTGGSAGAIDYLRKR